MVDLNNIKEDVLELKMSVEKVKYKLNLKVGADPTQGMSE